MDPKPPPSPSPSVTDGLSSGYSQPTQQEDVTSYPRDQPALEAAQTASRQGSRYPTPVPQAMPAYYEPAVPYSQGLQYSYPPVPANDESVYAPPPGAATPSMYNLHTPAASPPQDSLNLRSGTISRSSAGSKTLGVKSGRIEKSTPKKKKDRAIKSLTTMAALDHPLSTMNKDWAVPIGDIAEYVHRSAEKRREEVEMGKNPGRVKRPMNAFMLYRKAYQNLAKQWCLQNNHQIVSKVCGASWPLEPENVRDQFNEWARIERANHQQAHPGYKFSPAKPRKKSPGDELEDAASDGDLADFEWKSAAHGRSRTRTPFDDMDGEYRPSRSYTPASYLPGATSRPSHEVGFGGGAGGAGYLGYSQSTFHHSNLDGPMAARYEHGITGHGLYYEQTTQPGGHAMVEEVLARQTPSPATQYLGGHYQQHHHQYQHHPEPAFGLTAQASYHSPQPGAPQQLPQQARQSQGQESHALGVVAHPDHQQPHHNPIDPTLLSHDGLLYDPVPSLLGLDNVHWTPQFGADEDDGLPAYDETATRDLLQGAKDSWEVVDLDNVKSESWLDAAAES